jgi:hypothetical protein
MLQQLLRLGILFVPKSWKTDGCETPTRRAIASIDAPMRPPVANSSVAAATIASRRSSAVMREPREEPGSDVPLLDPYTVAHRADWTQFMTFVANRVNTVSGLKYRNDPTILVVSIAGEPIGPGYG